MNRLCLCFALLPLVLSAHDHSSPHISVAEDRQGRILLLNTSEEHCMLILGTDGGLLDIWGVRQTHR
jgi:hypothetical protein